MNSKPSRPTSSSPAPKTHFNFQRKLDRRTLLRGSGVAMALPMLTAMDSAFADSNASKPPKRFVGVTFGLGLVSKNLNPKKAGKHYESTPYLEPLEGLRESMTVISGSSHPGVKGGHRAESSVFTACPMGQTQNTISVDQLMAKHLGDATRFPSLVLSTSGASSPSFTANGAMIPPQTSAKNLFRQLFVDPSRAQRKQQALRVRQGRSIMELVGEDAKSLARTLGSEDRRRLGEYFSSVRDLEKRMAKAETWAKRPKPKVNAKLPSKQPSGRDAVGSFRVMCDLIKLALQTDSTRFITLYIPGTGGVIPLDGVQQGYHSLSHHGLDQGKLKQLSLIESALVKQWGDLAGELAGIQENSARLLDRTHLMLTSNLGNASSHDNRNMPVLIAGGGLRHAGHLAFDQKNNYPLPNLYVSILQNMGIETDRFATSTGTMRGLESS